MKKTSHIPVLAVDKLKQQDSKQFNVTDRHLSARAATSMDNSVSTTALLRSPIKNSLRSPRCNSSLSNTSPMTTPNQQGLIPNLSLSPSTSSLNSPPINPLKLSLDEIRLPSCTPRARNFLEPIPNTSRVSSTSKSPRGHIMEGLTPRGTGGCVNNSCHAKDVAERQKRMQMEQQAKIEEDVMQRKVRHEESIKIRENDLQAKELEARQQMWLHMICAVAPMYMLRIKEMEVRQKRLFQLLAIPLIQRWVRTLKKRRDRTRYTQEAMRDSHKPIPHTMVEAPLFKGWSEKALQRIIDSMTPRAYREGEIIAHEGDTGDEMFMLHKGSVEVLVRSKKPGMKKRNHANGFVVFTLQASTFFGEFTVLCDEPRSATLHCKEDVQLWVIQKGPFMAEVSQLPEATKERIVQMAEERRAANLMKLHRIKPDALINIPLFSPWDAAAAETFVDVARPRVARAGAVIYSEGQKSDMIYIVASGSITLTKEVQGSGGKSHQQQLYVAGAGTVFGEAEVLFPEHRWATATATVPSELWYVTKDVFMDLITTNPAWVLYGRKTANDFRARHISPLTVETIQAAFGITNVVTAKHLQTCLRPRVFGGSEMMTTNGQPVEDVILLVRGRAKDRGVISYDAGIAFGLTDEDRWQFSVKAVTCCETWTMKKTEYFEALKVVHAPSSKKK